MKKIALCLMAFGLSLSFYPQQTIAATTTSTSISEAAEAKVLLHRLNEINAMNKSALNSSERKDLRKEVRAIRYRLVESGGGVYISVGALIIIILLLIILL